MNRALTELYPRQLLNSSVRQQYITRTPPELEKKVSSSRCSKRVASPEAARRGDLSSNYQTMRRGNVLRQQPPPHSEQLPPRKKITRWEVVFRDPHFLERFEETNKEKFLIMKKEGYGSSLDHAPDSSLVRVHLSLGYWNVLREGEGSAEAYFRSRAVDEREVRDLFGAHNILFVKPSKLKERKRLGRKPLSELARFVKSHSALALSVSKSSRLLRDYTGKQVQSAESRIEEQIKHHMMKEREEEKKEKEIEEEVEDEEEEAEEEEEAQQDEKRSYSSISPIPFKDLKREGAICTVEDADFKHLQTVLHPPQQEARFNRLVDLCIKQGYSMPELKQMVSSAKEWYLLAFIIENETKIKIVLQEVADKATTKNSTISTNSSQLLLSNQVSFSNASV